MPILSALEDFLQRSLAPLPTLWEKLRFVCDLREGDTVQAGQHLGIVWRPGPALCHLCRHCRAHRPRVDVAFLIGLWSDPADEVREPSM